MYRSIYVSSAVEPFSAEMLSELLQISRRNNKRVGITGMLLYKGGNFMQILEGPRAEVGVLMAKIHGDCRHRGLITLLEEDGVKPEFQEWTMAFRRLDGAEAGEEGQSDLAKLPFASPEFQTTPSKCLKLLLSFKKVVGVE